MPNYNFIEYNNGMGGLRGDYRLNFGADSPTFWPKAVGVP